MVGYDKVQAGLTQYVETRIMPRLSKTGQFFAGMVLGLLAGKSGELFRALRENEGAKLLGLANEQGIDLERLYAAAKEQMRKQGDVTVELPMIGAVKLCEDDLDEMYQAILRG